MIDVDDKTKYAVILLFVISSIGICGNILNLFVMRCKSMRKLSTFRFLFYLSIIDLGVLIYSTIETFLRVHYKIDVRTISKASCRFNTFISYFLSQSSSVTLMMVSVERLVVISNESILNFLKRSKRLQRKNVITSPSSESIYSRVAIDRKVPTQQSKMLQFNQVNKEESIALLTKETVKIRIARKNPLDNIENSKLNYSNNIFKAYRVEHFMIITLLFIALINIHFLVFLNLNYIKMSENAETILQHNNTNDPISFNEANTSQHDNHQQSLLQEQDYMKILMTYQADERTYFKICFPLDDSNYRYLLNHVWVWIDISIYCLVPFIVITICSLSLILIIKHKSRTLLSRLFNSTKFSRRRSTRNNQIFILLIATNIFFIVCTMPNSIVSYKINKNQQVDPTLYVLFHIMSFLKNSFNFVIFGFFSKSYRNAVQKIYYVLKLNCSSYSDYLRMRT